MSHLLLDLGNTRAKWALWADGTLQERGAFVHGGALERLPEAWAGVSQVLLASVAAEELGQALMACLRSTGARVRRVTVTDGLCGVRVAYPDPRALGVDRWLAMLGARSAGQTAACIADCGTAVTLDALDAGGRHRGGAIAPGLALMRAGLARGAHRLPSVAEGDVPLLATNTDDAIRAGTVRGLAALLDGLAADYARELGDDVRFVLTGGDAALLSPYLHQRWCLEPDLVLHGLAALAGNC